MDNDQATDFADEVGKLRVLMEEQNAQLRAVHELVAAQPTQTEFNELKQDMSELKQDMKIVKAAVTDVSQQVANHERRITRLEAA